MESGVFALITQLLVLEKDLFSFEVIDYNTHSGIDIIVKNRNNLSLDQSSFFYIELKNLLTRDFNHSFKYLHSIICWDTKIKDGDEVKDIQGNSRIMKIFNPVATDDYTKYLLDDDRSRQKIEVFVLKDYLKEKLNIEFRPRGKK